MHKSCLHKLCLRSPNVAVFEDDESEIMLFKHLEDGAESGLSPSASFLPGHFVKQFARFSDFVRNDFLISRI